MSLLLLFFIYLSIAAVFCVRFIILKNTRALSNAFKIMFVFYALLFLIVLLNMLTACNDLILLFSKQCILTILLSLFVVERNVQNIDDDNNNRTKKNFVIYFLFSFVLLAELTEIAEQQLHGQILLAKYAYIAFIIFYNVLLSGYVFRLREQKSSIFSKKDIKKIVLILLGVEVLSFIVLWILFIGNSGVILDYAIYAIVLLHLYLAIRYFLSTRSKFKLSFSFEFLENDYNTQLILINNLIQFFVDEKPYLNPNLQLREVSRKVFTNKTYISYVLNNNISMNFNQFVNYFRIKHACEYFIRDKSLSINDLYVMCGFNSFVSFNSAFKSFTGYGPTEWCKMVKKGCTSNENDCINKFVE